jgi:methyl-accepting chemotaxis protein
MTHHPYKRKQYLVDRGYQLRFVTRVFVVVLAVAVVSSLIASMLIWRNMYRADLEQQTMFIAGLIAVATTLLIELLIAIPVVFYLGIRQSHRVVGPVNRIKAALNAIADGDFNQRITLRQGDALEDLAKAINQMAEKLQQRNPRA